MKIKLSRNYKAMWRRRRRRHLESANCSCRRAAAFKIVTNESGDQRPLIISYSLAEEREGDSKKQLPMHKLLPKMLKSRTSKRLGEDISNLIQRRNMLDLNASRSNPRSKVMKTNRQVLGSRPGAMIGGNFNARLIVLKNTTLNFGSWHV